MAKTLHFVGRPDEEARDTLAKHDVGLTVEEARKVQVLLGRPPTIVEAVIFGIQGSEHSSYKSSKPFLKLLPTDGKHVILGPKEDSGIIAITDEKEGPHFAPDGASRGRRWACPPKSASGGRRWGIVISHESHNHPSQVVPYEGAATGVGGCVRDVLCMGARVIGVLDPLRFGDLKTEETRTIATQVVQGIAGYGNAIGVPNLGGDTVFHPGFNQNCLVNVVALGLIREDRIIHSYVPKDAAHSTDSTSSPQAGSGQGGYDIIIVGKPTDRSGFGGSAFASKTLKEEEREANTGAVQEPNPFLERHLMDSFYALFDRLAEEGNLHKIGCKDLGAGGVVCSTVEQIAGMGLGADIDLEKVHRSIRDLPPEVIACAETQERMCIMCPPDLTGHILKHFNETWDLPSIAEGAKASVIGKATGDGMYRLRFKGEIVCEARATDITKGLLYRRETKEWKPKLPTPKTGKDNIEETFLRMLEDPNHCSKAPIYRHYDKNIQGATLLECGEADAGVILPLEEVWAHRHAAGGEAKPSGERLLLEVGARGVEEVKPREGKLSLWRQGEASGEEVTEEDRFVGVAVSTDGNPRYGILSPYWQGANAVVEAMRNVAAVGATPRALTDCLNYGNPEDPGQMWQFAEGVRGIADAASGVALEGEAVPVISGNVSLYNTSADPTCAEHSRSIPPSAIVCCIGVMADGRKAISQQLKRTGSTLYLLGERKDEGDSNVPKPDFEEVRRQILFVTEAIEKGILLSCHDISDGGLLLALFEMTIPQRGGGGKIGVDVTLQATSYKLQANRFLFSETGGFLMEVGKGEERELQKLSTKHSLRLFTIGRTNNEKRLHVRNGEMQLLNLGLSPLHRKWAGVLEEKLGL